MNKIKNLLKNPSNPVAILFLVSTFMIAGAILVYRGTFPSLFSIPNTASLLKNIPSEFYVCDHFDLVFGSKTRAVNSSAVSYDIQGDCPLNPPTFVDNYLKVLKSSGWVIRGQDGVLEAYNPITHQSEEMEYGDDSSNPNKTSIIKLVISTGINGDPFKDSSLSKL
jgi:hypothetical protein